MTQSLDIYYKPERCQGQVHSGVLSIFTQGTVLEGLLEDTVVDVEISFECEPYKGHWRLFGHLEASVRLICQRSLEPFDFPLNSDFSVIVMGQDEIETADKDWEPVLLNERGLLDLGAFVKEEIVLSIPMMPVRQQ